ncbi:conserved hypothetical protein [Thermosinus carboxydivorans Nor1]|uniref:DUF4127 family protein n=1 Tax=Thermosinus carboxydivorans Nor1 TaxID=401526 RepID=A1HQ28_9FIRM|nr:DUF4127 family protein [Thermosinus carboxydivorans]EAX47877.1 conserved hypothetical protein [Thermosinus carboxydivorans Nor1]
MKKFLFILAVLLFITATSTAWAKAILYVPIDNRPVSLAYPTDTVKAANFDILSPPIEYLASAGQSGDPERLWQWLEKNANNADAMVLSADSLIYGGLVDSRTHDFSSVVLEWRLQRFNKLKAIAPDARIYVFTTIMRTPRASNGGVEPLYYATYGGQIFQLTALQDKAEVQGLTGEEQAMLETAAKAVPPEFLADWFKRRGKNYKVNAGLINLTKAGKIDFLLVGRDDTSPFSQSHKESRLLAKLAEGLSADQYASFPGADQLGMVLLARAYNELTNQKPIVKIEYALGKGPATLASYEDQPIDRTILELIKAAGAEVANGRVKPDLLLAVNTPLTGNTPEAEIFDNIAMPSQTVSQFVDAIERGIQAGTPVAVADIAFANGADNSLLHELFARGLLDKLHAYSGWNTASNTLGYAVGQGMLAREMPLDERKRLLAIRYLDDWAYQANLRKEIYRELLYSHQSYSEFIGELEPQIAQETERRIRQFAQQYLLAPPEKIHISFPWHRMFEISVEIDPKQPAN